MIRGSKACHIAHHTCGDDNRRNNDHEQQEYLRGTREEVINLPGFTYLGAGSSSYAVWVEVESRFVHCFA